VDSDGDTVEMIEGYLSVSLPIRITTVATIGEALCEELTHRHDAVLASLDLDDGTGLQLAEQIRKSNRCPFLLMAEDPTPESLVAAMRMGICDVLFKPIQMAELSERLEAAFRSRRHERARRCRQRRLRLLSARMIRERRDLRQQTDLICKDLVHAYRALVNKVSESGILTGR